MIKNLFNLGIIFIVFVLSLSKACAGDYETFFNNVKIHKDRQNKHIPSKHNYEFGRSIFEHPDPQRLVDKFAGKGTAIKNRQPGRPDYREKVNFGEFIGYHVNETTGLKTSTT